MFALAAAALFVIGGLYVRRHYGGAALAGVTLVAIMVMSLFSVGSFVALLRGLGVPMSNTGGALVAGMMVAMQASSFGCAALAIHLLRKEDGPWLNAPGFAFGLLGYTAGGVLGVAVVAAAIFAGAAGMAK